MWSHLLDRGREALVVWPVIQVTADRGSKEYEPDLENPIRMKVTTSEDRSQVADLHGQIDVDILRAVTRSFPSRAGATWSRCLLNGIEYDMAEPPRWSAGPSRSMSHWEFKLRSRANLGATEIADIEEVPLIVRRTE
ncbi:hypothetical protein Q7C18_02775 [Nesterenkonia sp. CL21]|uniref:hypothetical protein n=1 Tax=Nesterenkonia sp. CL21 TaxID=3064894 RepID=UPI00287A222F|nr:hypothetical protein [Nesterenkonia sp. CL21]MDS2171613.1 hypothetical protein [Nesterenkonia sp. CL21]